MNPQHAPAPGWQEIATEARFVATWKMPRALGVIYLIGVLFFGTGAIYFIAEHISKNNLEGWPERSFLALAITAPLVLLIPLWFAYLTATSFLNTTQVAIDLQNFCVVHAPIPQFGNVRAPLEQVSHVASQVVQRPKGQVGHGVFVHMTNTKTKLVVMYTDPVFALNVARRLDQVLKYFQAKARGPYR